MLYEIGNDSLKIIVDSFGAELQSIVDTNQNQEILWQADKRHWARHAPILFPIIGRLKNDELKIKNNTYPISQHGFARDSGFSLVSKDESHVLLSLKSSDKTRIHYPFEFELQVEYCIQNSMVSCHFTVINPSQTMLPFSLGGHPAFNWPLSPDVPKEQHRIVFDKTETGRISQLTAGLVSRDDLPSPLNNNVLNLSEDLFDHDALIFKEVRSKVLRYEAIENDEIKACIEVQYENFNDLGIWTKPGADFVCIEPWLGYSSSVDFDGDFDKKAGLIQLAPESEQNFSFTIKLSL